MNQKMKRSHSHIIEAISSLLKILQIKAIPGQVRKILLAHPDYPSLLSISESLLEWGIKTEALKGTIHDLSAADFPGIVYLKSNEYVVAQSIQDENITLVYPGNNRQILSLENFSNLWSGILLKVLKETIPQEFHYPTPGKKSLMKGWHKAISWPGLLLFILASFFYLMFSHPPINLLLPIGVIKILGIGICAVLFLSHSRPSDLLNSICPSGKISNCKRVINSPAGKIFGIPMAELGILYFSGGFLVLFFSLLADSVQSSIFILGILSFISLPYTFFSVAYQALVVHSWCWLCLTVQVLFWFEAVILYHKVIHPIKGLPSPIDVDWFPLLSGFGLVLLIWLSFRHVLKEYPVLKEKEAEFNRLRCNPQYIKYQLKQVPQIPITPFPAEIMIGLPSAPITLALVANPLCGHCSKAFNQLKQMIHMNPGRVRGVVRFIVDPNENEMSESERKNDYQIALAIAILAVSQKQNEMEEALYSWFSHKESLSPRFIRHWLKKYATSDKRFLKQAREFLLMHEQWANDNHINRIPTLFMNGHMLPLGFCFSNLKYFLLRLPV